MILVVAQESESDIENGGGSEDHLPFIYPISRQKRLPKSEVSYWIKSKVAPSNKIKIPKINSNIDKRSASILVFAVQTAAGWEKIYFYQKDVSWKNLNLLEKLFANRVRQVLFCTIDGCENVYKC